MLCKKGYGSLVEIEEWDAKQFLDVLEYESILRDIEAYQLKKQGA